VAGKGLGRTAHEESHFITANGSDVYVGGYFTMAGNKSSIYLAHWSQPNTYCISGRITDSNNGPMSGVTLSDGAGHTAVTDGDGNYVFSGLLSRIYTLIPSKSGYTFSPPSLNVTVPPNATGQNFTGTLLTYSISGGAVDRNNNPIAGVTINCNGLSTRTGSDGNYIFSGLFPGTYLCAAGKAGYTFLPSSLAVSVPPNATGQDFVSTNAATATPTPTLTSTPTATPTLQAVFNIYLPLAIK
jgi:Carboxypeptidase regulatory-like domain